MTRDLTTGSPMRLIAGFTLPTLLGLLFQQLYNLVDTMIVGKLLGSAALAAVGSTGSISFLVIGFCMGICNGFAIPVAQRIGAGEPSKMRRYVANAAYLGAGIAVVLTAATGLLCRTILTAMQTPEEIFADAYSLYLRDLHGYPGLHPLQPAGCHHALSGGQQDAGLFPGPGLHPEYRPGFRFHSALPCGSGGGGHRHRALPGSVRPGLSGFHGQALPHPAHAGGGEAV